MATSAAAVQDEPATKFAKDQLKAIIERIERLEEEKKTISDDIRDVYAEAKGNGFDVKALRTIVRMRKQDANERAEQKPFWRPTCRRWGCCEAFARRTARRPDEAQRNPGLHGYDEPVAQLCIESTHLGPGVHPGDGRVECVETRSA